MSSPDSVQMMHDTSLTLLVEREWRHFFPLLGPQPTSSLLADLRVLILAFFVSSYVFILTWLSLVAPDVRFALISGPCKCTLMKGDETDVEFDVDIFAFNRTSSRFQSTSASFGRTVQREGKQLDSLNREEKKRIGGTVTQPFAILFHCTRLEHSCGRTRERLQGSGKMNWCL